MKRKMIMVWTVGVAFLMGCASGNDDTPPNTGGGGDPIQATYRLTIEPQFTAIFYPNDFPANPTFTRPLIIAHGNQTSIFRIGSFASPGLKLYAEDGDSSLLIDEHTPQDDNEDRVTIVQGGSDLGPEQQGVYTIIVDPETTFMSFLTRMSPSPDWFLGMDTFDLIGADNLLIEDITIPLFAVDAGTDGGSTYESENTPENTAIQLRTGLPLSTDPNGTGKSIAQLRIERID